MDQAVDPSGETPTTCSARSRYSVNVVLPKYWARAAQDLGSQVKPLTSEGWVGLLEGAELRDIVARTYEIRVQEEAKGLLGRYGYGGMLRIMWRMLVMYVRNPAYRRFVKGVGKSGVMPPNLTEYLGYGIYVGRKDQADALPSR